MEDWEFYDDLYDFRRVHRATEDRKTRRVHPYSRPKPSQNKQRKEYPTFDLAIRDLKQLMKCHTTTCFRETNKRRTIYNQHRMPKQGCRFSHYHFSRSPVQDAETCENRQSPNSKTSSVIETSPNITVIDCSSSASASKLYPNEDSNIPPAVIHKKNQAGINFELCNDKSDCIVLDASVQGALSDNGLNTGNKDCGNETDLKDDCISTLQDSDLVSCFSDFETGDDFHQNSIGRQTVEGFILTTEDLAAPVSVPVNHVPSQNLIVITNAEFSSNAVKQSMLVQPTDPCLRHERNNSVVQHSTHEAVPTVSSELVRSASNEKLANSVFTIGLAQMRKCDMENGCNSCPEKVLNASDQCGILPSGSCPDCETTEDIMPQPTTSTDCPPHSQLNVSQVCVQPDHTSTDYPPHSQLNVSQVCVQPEHTSTDCSPHSQLNVSQVCVQPEHTSTDCPSHSQLNLSQVCVQPEHTSTDCPSHLQLNLSQVCVQPEHTSADCPPHSQLNVSQVCVQPEHTSADCPPHSQLNVSQVCLQPEHTSTDCPPHSQLNVSQVCLQPEHCNSPGTPLSSSSVYSDLMELCQSSNDVTPAVSSDYSLGQHTYPEAKPIDSESIPVVEKITARDGLGDQNTQLTILKQLIDKVQDLQTQISQNVKSSSLHKAIKYLKEKSKNFTTFSCTAHKNIVPSVMSDPKLQHQKHETLVQQKEKRHHVDDSVTRAQSSSARMDSGDKEINLPRMKDAQLLQPKEDRLKWLMEQQREESNMAGHRRRKQSVKIEKYCHPHHEKRNHRPKMITQDSTNLGEYAAYPDLENNGYRLVEFTVDSSKATRRKLKCKRGKKVKSKKCVAEVRKIPLSPVITRNQLLDISNEKTHVITSDMSNEPFYCKHQMSFEPLEMTEKTSQVMPCESSVATYNELSHVRVCGPDSLVTTNRAVMLQPTDVVRESSQLSPDKVSREDSSIMTIKEMLLHEPTKGTSCHSPLPMTIREISSGLPEVTASSGLLKSEESMNMLRESTAVTGYEISHSLSEIITSKILLEPLSETTINLKKMSNEVTGSVPYQTSHGVISVGSPEHSETAVSKIVNPDEMTTCKMDDRAINRNVCITNSLVGSFPHCEVNLKVNSQTEANSNIVLDGDSDCKGCGKSTECHECKDTPIQDIADLATSNVLNETNQLKMLANSPQCDFSCEQSTGQYSSAVQMNDNLMLATDGLKCEPLMSSSINDTVNVADTLKAGEYVNEFQKKHALRSFDVAHTNASNLVTCCEKQQVPVLTEVTGAELSRIINQIEQTVENEISQRVNTNILETCRKCTVSSVKSLCPRYMPYSNIQNPEKYSESAYRPGSPASYEDVCSLSETLTSSGQAVRPCGRNQPSTEMPQHNVYEAIHFQPTQSCTSFKHASSDQSVNGRLKATEDELSEDLLHSAAHQSQKQPDIRCFLKTSQLHPSACSTELPLHQQLTTQWDVGVSPLYPSQSGYKDTQADCLSGDFLQDSDRKRVSHSQTSCSYLDISRKRRHSKKRHGEKRHSKKRHSKKRHSEQRHSMSLDSASKRHCSKPNGNETGLVTLLESPHNAVQVADVYHHDGDSSAEHIKNIRSDSPNEEHVLKAEALLGCLIEAISRDVRRSPRNVVSRHSEVEICKNESSSLLESSYYKHESTREFNHDGNFSRRRKNARSHSAYREHLRKAKALVDSPAQNACQDVRLSPLKVNKKFHANPRTKDSFDDEENITVERYHPPDNSSPRRRKNARSHSAYREHLRKAKTLVDSPAQNFCQDVRLSPLKINKKRHANLRTKDSSSDEDNITNDHYHSHDNNSSTRRRKNARYHSAYREHLRKAKTLLDSPAQNACQDVRLSPLKVHKKRHANPRTKDSSSDEDNITNDHYHSHDNNSSTRRRKNARCHSAYREHLRKAKTLLDSPAQNACQDVRLSPLKVHKKRHANPRTKDSSSDEETITSDHYQPHGKDSSPRRRKNTRSHSVYREHLRKAKALLDSPVQNACQDLSLLPLKVHKKHHANPRTKDSSSDEDNITSDHYHPDNGSSLRRKNARSHSVYREHLRRAKALVDSPVENACQDVRLSPLKVNKKFHANPRTKDSFHDEENITSDHYHPPDDNNSSPRRRKNARSQSAYREHLRKAKAYHVRLSPQKVPRKHHANPRTKDSFHDEENITSDHYPPPDDNNSSPRRRKNARSQSAYREHLRKAKAYVRLSPQKVPRKHHANPRTKDSSSDDEDITSGCCQLPDNSSPKNARTHSACREHLRKAKALLDCSAKFTSHDVRWSPYKNKHRANPKKAKRGSSSILKTAHKDTVTNQLDHIPGNDSSQERSIARSLSAYREHFRKAQALRDFPVDQVYHDIRWSPMNKRKTYKNRFKYKPSNYYWQDMQMPAEKSVIDDDSQKHSSINPTDNSNLWMGNVE